MAFVSQTVHWIRSALVGVTAVAAISAHAEPRHTWDFAVVHAFQPDEGKCPVGPLVQGSDGHWYGTTREGGKFDGGTVFRLARDGSVKVLHNFNPANETSHPSALTAGPDGMFYGASTGNYESAPAVVYRIDSAGSMQIIHRFDRYVYSSRVIFGPDGALYGNGGQGSGPWWAGAVYRLTLDDQLSVLYLLGREANAPVYAMGAPAFGVDGWLYGASNVGGDWGFGTVFRVSMSGTSEILHSFLRFESDGQQPFDGPTAGADGSIYGTTAYGSPFASGTVWGIDPAGGYTSLHSMATDGFEGYWLYGGVALRKHGALVGATYASTNGNGTVYKLEHNGKLKVLHTFAADGHEGTGSKDMPAVDRDGEIWGTACAGGPGDRGTIYRITPQP